MARTVGIGIQSLQTIRERQCFYVDKAEYSKRTSETTKNISHRRL